MNFNNKIITMGDNSSIKKSTLVEDDSDEEDETVMTFGDDELNYSDFENIEYVKFEEVNADLRGRQGSECSSINATGSCNRKRTRNFTTDECTIMSALIDEYSDILEIKRNDHKTNTLKNEAWNEISEKFNNTTHEIYRTPMQLKTFYENLKRKRKKNESEGCEKNNSCEKSSDSEITKKKPVVINKVHTETNMPMGFKRHNNFLEYYQVKKIKLVEMEIEKIKSATEQQRRLFLLQEEKLMLEIQEIREKLKRNRKLDVD